MAPELIIVSHKSYQCIHCGDRDRPLTVNGRPRNICVPCHTRHSAEAQRRRRTERHESTGVAFTHGGVRRGGDRPNHGTSAAAERGTRSPPTQIDPIKRRASIHRALELATERGITLTAALRIQGVI